MYLLERDDLLPMNLVKTISDYLNNRFDTDGDLLLKRNILLAMFTYSITLFFQVIYISRYLSGSLPLVQLLLALVSISVLLFGVYLLVIQKRHQLSITVLVVYLVIRQNTTVGASLSGTPLVGIAWLHIVAFALVFMLGTKRSVVPSIIYSGSLIVQIYLGLGNSAEDEWDAARLRQFIYVQALVLFVAYFNEWSTAKAFRERQEAREQARKDAQQHAEQLEKMLENKKQLLVDVSHELRTPLSVLKVSIEAMEDGINKEKDTYPLLHSNVNQIDRLIEDLYLISKSEIQQLTLYIDDIVMTELLDDLFSSFQPLAKEKGLTLTINHTGTSNCSVEGDSQRLIQLFGNLLQNSMDYTDRGGRIELITRTLPTGVEVTVQDSAPGVPEEEYTLLFERLYRKESSRSRATGGSGLGLTICKLIAEAHEGSINITASPLGGLAVTTCLPLTQSTAD